MIKLRGYNDRNGCYKLGLLDYAQIVLIPIIILAISLLIVYSH